MNEATVLRLLLILVPLGVALAVYGLLRERDMRGASAGCVAIGAGLVASFLITGVLLLFAVT